MSKGQVDSFTHHTPKECIGWMEKRMRWASPYTLHIWHCRRLVRPFTTRKLCLKWNAQMGMNEVYIFYLQCALHLILLAPELMRWAVTMPTSYAIFETLKNAMMIITHKYFGISERVQPLWSMILTNIPNTHTHTRAFTATAATSISMNECRRSLESILGNFLRSLAKSA